MIHTATDTLKYNLPRIQLMLVHEGEPPEQLHQLRQPKDAVPFLEPLRRRSEEHFVALHVNARHEIIGLHEVSHGTVSSSLVHPREVFKAALLANTHAIVVCHNHPSGSPLSPSLDDIKTTRQLVQAGNFLGIPVVDHLIVGPAHSEPYSMREHNEKLFE